MNRLVIAFILVVVIVSFVQIIFLLLPHNAMHKHVGHCLTVHHTRVLYQNG